MEKADAIQARQRREDEEISVVLSRTSFATLVLTGVLMMGALLATGVSSEILQSLITVVATVPGVVTSILRFKNRG
ncbi:hypothetical protein [Streptomyces sp. NRRL S-337]|uniref:hypothetical protein n=1 Tax=Streptomyces sp. NRRL S-337 TaxID=1463900 RepID=UPI00131B8370|nr:hypothetical protein [Streptomyces sp. NRRL S-337]